MLRGLARQADQADVDLRKLGADAGALGGGQDAGGGLCRQLLRARIGAPDLGSALAKLSELSTVLQASQASFSKLANLSIFDVLR